MSTALPDHFFRLHDNGATVFRVSTENRLNRLEMEPVAVINICNGEVKPQGGELTDAGRGTIDAWMAERRGALASREIAAVEAAIEALNLTAHWGQTKAGDDELDAVTDRPLLAMHDLREVLVRKKAVRLPK